MPRFEPFRGVRYDSSRVALADVVAPPYDVIGAERQRQLEDRSPCNAVHVELSRAAGGQDRYEAARCAFDQWLAQGVLVRDDEPSFYVYRMGYHDDEGRPRQTTGVLGALGLGDEASDGAGEASSAGVLPHERTMAKPKDDRLNLLRTCRANLSPIWGLSLASGLSGLLERAGPPDERLTDDDGVHHRLWRVVEPGSIAAISATAANAPVVIADGHHRYATALAYRDECRAANGDRAGDHDLVLTYLVELADDELTVGAIHRAISGLPTGFDVVAALAEPGQFGLEPVAPETAEALGGRAGSTGGLRAPVLLAGDAAWWLVPPDAVAPENHHHGVVADAPRNEPAPGSTGASAEPDAAVVEKALGAWPAHDVTYVNSGAELVATVRDGRAQAGLLLRPPTVAQIAAVARAGGRMPQKTTFFKPKPLTGMVFRRLDPSDGT